MLCNNAFVCTSLLPAIISNTQSPDWQEKQKKKNAWNFLQCIAFGPYHLMCKIFMI